MNENETLTAETMGVNTNQTERFYVCVSVCVKSNKRRQASEEAVGNVFNVFKSSK